MLAVVLSFGMRVEVVAGDCGDQVLAIVSLNHRILPL